jgi:hypothetical protein
MEDAAMKYFVAIAAAIAIQLVAAFAFQRSADEARPTPNGEVIVTELALDAPTLVNAGTGKARPAVM